jgi:hypothetical protein
MDDATMDVDTDMNVQNDNNEENDGWQVVNNKRGGKKR